MARILGMVMTAILATALGIAPALAQKAYITNYTEGSLSVIDTATNTVTSDGVTFSAQPSGVAVTPDGTKVYIAEGGGGFEVIFTSDNFAGGFNGGTTPYGVAATPDSSKVYITNSGSNTVSVIPTSNNTMSTLVSVGTAPLGVAVTPDGSKVYVANSGSNSVSVIATANNTVIATIPVGTAPNGVAVTPDGSKVYVANNGSNSVSVIATASNAVVGNPIIVGTAPYGVAVTPDGGSVYVTNSSSNTVSVIATASNTIVGNPIVVGSHPQGVAITPDGSKVYVANFGADNVSVIATASNTVTAVLAVGTGPLAFGNFIAPPSLTVVETGGGSGQVTSSPAGINCSTANNQCAASFRSGSQITLTGTAASGSTFVGWSGGGCAGTNPCAVTLTADTTVTASFVQNSASSIALLAAVLPLSRSVEVGNTATAFATILNTGPGMASACTIAPATTLPASFGYQTTDPTTNALTGAPNTPANIAQGAGQSFVIAFTPSAAFAPTDVLLTFACANANPAPQNIGLDTLNLSASATPVPDIVALAASSDPGYVDIPGTTGTGDFVVATVNLGSDGTITAAANTGSITLPVTLTLCETNPATGACLAAPAATVTTDIAPNATPTFGIFVTGSGTVADMPGTNRVFMTFTDGGGTLRGETSVAVRSQ